MLCHFGLRNGVFTREGGYISCHEQQLMQRELEMPSETCGPAKDSGRLENLFGLTFLIQGIP